MKNIRLGFLLFTPFIFSSCVVAVNAPQAPNNSAAAPLQNIALNGKVYSAFWQQNSGEFRALCYQAFNIATERIAEYQKKSSAKPLAIITDIDETFLDNSPYAVTEAEKGKDFDPKTWMQWTAKGEAKPYPGAVDFFRNAAAKNVTVFYITNRDGNDRVGTLKNLRDLGFPFADDAHLMLKNTTSDKESRRRQVLEKYDVVLYLGDNLADFADIFYHKNQDERNRATDQNAAEFGKKFIVLPNSGYGDWETALPAMKNKTTTGDKDSALLQNVRGY